jgi:A1 cistron-splicing factor AAR2
MNMAIDQDQANALYEQGAILLLLDTPANTEFGIDCHVWRVGDRFKGIKLIPPGVHCFYFRYFSFYQ